MGAAMSIASTRSPTGEGAGTVDDGGDTVNRRLGGIVVVVVVVAVVAAVSPATAGADVVVDIAVRIALSTAPASPTEAAGFVSSHTIGAAIKMRAPARATTLRRRAARDAADGPGESWPIGDAARGWIGLAFATGRNTGADDCQSAECHCSEQPERSASAGETAGTCGNTRRWTIETADGLDDHQE